MPDVLVALELWPGQIKVIGPISEEQRMAAGFRKDSPGAAQGLQRLTWRAKADGTYMRLVKNTSASPHVTCRSSSAIAAGPVRPPADALRPASSRSCPASTSSRCCSFVAYAVALFVHNLACSSASSRACSTAPASNFAKQADSVSALFSERHNPRGQPGRLRRRRQLLRRPRPGMTIEYGLGLHLQNIEDRFAQLIEQERLGERRIHDQLVLIDRTARLIAEAGDATAPRPRTTRPGPPAAPVPQPGPAGRAAAALQPAGVHQGTPCAAM